MEGEYENWIFPATRVRGQLVTSYDPLTDWAQTVLTVKEKNADVRPSHTYLAYPVGIQACRDIARKEKGRGEDIEKIQIVFRCCIAKDPETGTVLVLVFDVLQAGSRDLSLIRYGIRFELARRFLEIDVKWAATERPLDGGEKYISSACLKNVDAEKTRYLIRSPPLFSIHRLAEIKETVLSNYYTDRVAFFKDGYTGTKWILGNQ